MASQRYEVVRYTPGFRDHVAEFQTGLWSPDVALNAAYLDWKHGCNPYLSAPLVYLALHENRIVGMRGFYGAKWTAGQSSQPVTVPVAADFLVAPAHRDQGVVTRLMRVVIDDVAKQGLSHLFNFSAGPVTRVGALAMGWRSTPFIGRMHWETPRPPLASRLRRIARRRPRLERVVRPLLAATGAHQEAFRQLDRHFARRRDRRITLEKAPHAEAMAGMVARVSTGGRFEHVRDAAFFTWRFQNPLAEYRFLFCGDSPLEGFLVLGNRVPTPRPWVRIVAWEATSPRVAEELLAAAMRAGNFGDVRVWSESLPSPHIEVLRRAGFESMPTHGGVRDDRPSILICPLRQGGVNPGFVLAGRDLLDLANWRLSMLDTDRC